jgi:hypothetical protein
MGLRFVGAALKSRVARKVPEKKSLKLLPAA